MSDNILSEFEAFIQKSAQAMGGVAPVAGQVTSGQGAPREGSTDAVNNTMSAGISNPSHGGAMGMPKPITTPGKPLTSTKW